jgi:hypothetical protein
MDGLPDLINDMKHIREAYDQSIGYLVRERDTANRIGRLFRAYYEIDDLLPLTLENVTSGHSFPFHESYSHLESAYQLCLHGFYTYALFGLRLGLELGLLTVYFAADDREHEEVRPWILSRERTPSFKTMVSRVSTLPGFVEFDGTFAWSKKMRELYDVLSADVHIRGYKHSATGHARANFNRFSESALGHWVDMLSEVVVGVVEALLLKWPIGLQKLPLSEKFGEDGPAGGLLEGYQVQIVTDILPQEVKALLKKISDQDPKVRTLVQRIELMPDLTPEELEKQQERWDEILANVKWVEPKPKDSG